MFGRRFFTVMIIFSSLFVAMCASRNQTVTQVLAEYEPKAKAAYSQILKAAKINYPPVEVTLIAVKQERKLEVWAKGNSGKFVRIARYPILAASGELGPKRKEGDKQVPEGIYTLPSLNPNSKYHLSIKVGYPNSTDIKNSKISVKEMGGDIFVHGRSVSIGCIAIGDKAIEDLFCLVARVPVNKRKIIITPVDFRIVKNYLHDEEEWVNQVYESIKEELKNY